MIGGGWLLPRPLHPLQGPYGGCLSQLVLTFGGPPRLWAPFPGFLAPCLPALALLGSHCPLLGSGGPGCLQGPELGSPGPHRPRPRCGCGLEMGLHSAGPVVVTLLLPPGCWRRRLPLGQPGSGGGLPARGWGLFGGSRGSLLGGGPQPWPVQLPVTRAVRAAVPGGGSHSTRRRSRCGLGCLDRYVAGRQPLLPEQGISCRPARLPPSVHPGLTSALFSPQGLSAFCHRPPRPPSVRDSLISSPIFHGPRVGDPEWERGGAERAQCQGQDGSPCLPLRTPGDPSGLLGQGSGRSWTHEGGPVPVPPGSLWVLPGQGAVGSLWGDEGVAGGGDGPSGCCASRLLGARRAPGPR